MTLLYMNGLDGFTNIADALASDADLTDVSGYSAILTTGGRFGGGALRTQYGGFEVAAPAPQGATRYLGYAYNAPIASNRGDMITAINSNGSDVCGVTLYPNGQVQGFVGSSTLVGSISSVLIIPNVWNWIEFKIKMGTNNTNGEMALRINGVEVFNLTGIDTYDSTYTLRGFQLGLVSRNEYSYVDDLVIWDDQGSVNNTWLGDLRIDTLVPNGAGTYGSLTPNTGLDYQAVDDTPSANDGDTTYIAGTGAAVKSSFTMGDLPSTSSAILGVMVEARVRKTDAGDITYKTLMRSGSTDRTDAASRSPVTSYVQQQGDIVELDPADSTAWTDADVNALEAGVEIQ